MFARSVIRSASKARSITVIRPAARAAFTAGSRLREPVEIIAERNVPTSSYADGEVQRSTLQVRDQGVTPLASEIYNVMPPTLKKMTVMGKTIIVTGYVL